MPKKKKKRGMEVVSWILGTSSPHRAITKGFEEQGETPGPHGTTSLAVVPG